MNHKKLIAASAILASLTLVLLLPQRANAGVGDIVQLLETITTTLRGKIGIALGGIQSVRTSFTNFEQQVIWPLDVINQTKSFVTATRLRYTSLAQRLYNIPLTSATLPNPVQLESVLRSGQAGNINQIANTFARVYRGLPAPADAREQDRNLIDTDDSAAVAALKTAMIADQSSQSTLGVADGLEGQTETITAGTAAFLTAQAQATGLASEAALHKLLAAELRAEAAKLAHDNRMRKNRAQSAASLRNQLQQMLSR